MNDICGIADGTVSVRIWRPGSDYERTVERALFRPDDHVTIERNRVVPQERGYWYLDGTEYEKPLPGDRIDIGDGEDWMIERLVYSRLAGNWRCFAGRYVVTFGIDEFFDLLKPVYVKSDGGTLEERFTTLKTGILAKFSGEEFSAVDAHHPDGHVSRSASRHPSHERQRSCYFLCKERLSLPENALLRRGDGSLWEIVRIRHPVFDGGWTEGEIVRIEN